MDDRRLLGQLVVLPLAAVYGLALGLALAWLLVQIMNWSLGVLIVLGGGLVLFEVWRLLRRRGVSGAVDANRARTADPSDRRVPMPIVSFAGILAGAGLAALLAIARGGNDYALLLALFVGACLGAGLPAVVDLMIERRRN